MTAEFKKPEAIIFDWDDTLVVNWQSIHGALNAALTAMGHKIWSMEKARANIRRSLRESFPKMFGDQWEEASDIFYSHIEKNHLSTLKSIDFAKDLIVQLKRDNILLGIVSNKRGDLLRAECNYLGWDNYFTNVIGANDAVRDKPAADPLLLCLKGTSIKPSLTSTWYVGDAPTDLECAINAGVTGVLIKDSDLTPDYQEFPPLMHFRNLNKMADFLA
jgi:phosphoglycolate phosphatase